MGRKLSILRRLGGSQPRVVSRQMTIVSAIGLMLSGQMLFYAQQIAALLATYVWRIW
jgi:hypothetical protein